MINAVIDISHHNGPSLDFAKARAAGIIGVIHKATQGLNNTDDMYAVNRMRAKNAGLLWGAYHFGTGVDGGKQAAHFLETIVSAKDTLLVLDFEPHGAGPTMTLDQARAFTAAIFKATGRWPGLYSGQLIKEQLGKAKDAVLAKSWFWLSQYGPKAVVPPNWPAWTMWQYTDGVVGDQPHIVDGIGPCDRERYNGTEKQLRAWWVGKLP
jgi:lysozyme